MRNVNRGVTDKINISGIPEKGKVMIKTASTSEIIARLQAYEKLNGVGSVESVATVCPGSREVEYIFYITDKNGIETSIDIPSIDKETLW